ncbi:MAG: hypothetical protein GY793_02865 [Proteobacteria bacterium]|nr:hypothetical protein [Pseudomonadota bacterium]
MSVSFKRLVRRTWWFIHGNLVWHHSDYWYGRYAWTGVNRKDMPNKYISKWQFLVYYSPVNSR